MLPFLACPPCNVCKLLVKNSKLLNHISTANCRVISTTGGCVDITPSYLCNHQKGWYPRHGWSAGICCCAGFALSSVVWLQMRAGLGFRCWNLWVCSLARYQSFWFLGLFNTWIPLPVSWAYGLLLRWRGTASNMLRVSKERVLKPNPNPDTLRKRE